MKSLIELLAEECGCKYVSDLSVNYYKLSPQFIKDIPADSYPLSEWQVLVSYVLKEKIDFDSVEAVKEYFLNELQ